MNDVELFRRWGEYDSDKDIEDTSRNHVAGSYGIYLADCLASKCELEDLEKWMMIQGGRNLEKEADLVQKAG